MTIFLLKITACITMLLDHIKYVLPVTNNFVTQYFGRLSFPIFAFLITEGYIHTSNLKKYYKRLIIFALISQIPFMMFRYFVGEWKLLNIMFTLLLGLVAITIYDKSENKAVAIPLVIITIILGDILKVDYGAFGVFMIVIFYIFRNNKILLSITFFANIVFHLFPIKNLELIRNYYQANGNLIPLIPQFLVAMFYMFSLPIIFLYNGKEGRKLKYFYYWFYPIHMLIIAIIGYFVVL